ncbi:MAG: hypothetical protein ACE5GD_08250 [Candidatus Geothermarchaeales archaeon]
MARSQERSEYVVKTLERLARLGVYTMGGEEAAAMLRETAHKLGLDLKKADLEKTREILGRGTPMAQIIREMRERWCCQST